MRAVVQRVSYAQVKGKEGLISKIGRGIVVLVGIDKEDTGEDAEYLASKLSTLRIFEDPGGKMNLSLEEVSGEALVISQFTLYGDCRKGRRPSFDRAAGPAKARDLYGQLLQSLRQRGVRVAEGRFQEKMLVELANDGPVTILLDSKKLF